MISREFIGSVAACAAFGVVLCSEAAAASVVCSETAVSAFASQDRSKVPMGVWTELAAFGRTNECVRPIIITDPAARTLIARGLTDLQNSDSEHDAWEIVYEGDCAYLIGASPRGVMQATWEYLSRPRDGKTRRGAFALKYRIHAGLVGGMIGPVGGSREKVRRLMRFLSYSGASHAAPVCDWGGDQNKSFFNYVDSEIFPRAASAGAPGTSEDRSARRKRLRIVCDAAKEYGLGILFETIMMPADTVYGKSRETEMARKRMIESFEEDVIGYGGSYQPWCLCVSHPKVSAFYREVTAKFLKEFPEVELIHYITLDAGGDFCEPGKCPRCGNRSKADLHDDASRLLLDAAQTVRPDVRIIASSFDWDRRRHLGDACADRQAALPPGIGFSMAAQTDPAIYESQCHERLRHAREVTSKAGQLFIGRDAFYRFDNAMQEGDVKGLLDDNPRTVRAKVRRWVELGADGYYDVRGRARLGGLALNGIFLRAALQNPFGDDADFAERMARELFGAAAQPEVVSAWAAERRADRIASSIFAFPSASRLTQYYPWFFGRSLSACLPDSPRFPNQKSRRGDCDATELPLAKANGWDYGDGTYSERLVKVGTGLVTSADHYERAAQSLGRAIMHLGDASAGVPFGVRALMGGDFKWNAKSYLENHLRFERLNAVCNRAMGRVFVLNGIYHEVEGDDKAYLSRVKPQRLAELREALRELDAVIGEEEKKGCFVRKQAFSKERFEEMFKALTAAGL